MSLTDRGGKAAWLAFGYLLFGAIVGVLIRFLNDPVAKLVSPYRRYRTVSRWVASLPAGVDAEGKLQGKLMDVEDALMFLDVAAANAALTELEELRSTSVDAAALRQGIAGVSSAPQRDRKTVPQPKRWRRIVFGMFHVYWVLALLALIIGVVAIGFVTRYVQNDAFSGTQRDWVGLVVFGLAAQITATTLSESLGRLLPSARSRS